MMIQLQNHLMAKRYASENIAATLGGALAMLINPYQTEIAYTTEVDDEYGDGYQVSLHDKTTGKGLKYFVPDDADVVLFEIQHSEDAVYKFIFRFEYQEDTHLVKYNLAPVNKPAPDSSEFQEYAQISMYVFQNLKNYEMQVVGQ